jgi:hypothetical protein
MLTSSTDASSSPHLSELSPENYSTVDTRDHISPPVVNDERDAMRAAGALHATSKRLNVSDRDLQMRTERKQNTTAQTNIRRIPPDIASHV